MTVAVKICGIRDRAALSAAMEADADWVGFVFFPPSPRFVSIEEAAALAKATRSGVGRIGLFVEPRDDEIEAVLDAVRLDALQIYASAERAASIRARFGRPVWRAVGVAMAGDLPLADVHADRLVIEAKPPAGSRRPGGNAAHFDWKILAGWRAPAPWILAGGLTPRNVVEAIRTTGATTVDVSSGVERAAGIKDPALIHDFVKAARSATPSANSADEQATLSGDASRPAG